MSAHHYYREIGGSLVEQTDRILREGWQVKGAAEEGLVPGATIAVADPLMTQDYTGHRRWLIIEDESEADDDVLFSGYTGAQEISRGEDPETFEPLGRAWSIELVDVNSLWARRVMTGTDCKRRAETDVERMQWLLSTNEASPWFENVTDYVSTASPVDMDKASYRGQMFNAIAEDCAQQSGKNWFVAYIKNGVSGDRELCAFYGAYTYDSPLFLSNDPADWSEDDVADGTSLVWPIAMATKLRRDPSRVFSGGYLQYEKGAVYRTRAATATAFALGGRDMIVPSGNVKTKAKAVVRVNRALQDVSTQDERITTEVTLPATKATMLKPGMRVPFKATHEPGYESYRYLRILNAAPKPVAAGSRYEIALELQGPGNAIACFLDPGLAGTPSDTYGPLGGTTTDSRGNVWYSAANANYFSPDHGVTTGPYPAQTCHGFGFPVYGLGGGDAGGVNVNSVVRFVFAGAGTMVASWPSLDGSYFITWRQGYFNVSGDTVEQSGTDDMPGSLTVTVAALPADAVSCYRYIDMNIGGGVSGPNPPYSGTKGVFGGLVWTLNS